MVAVDVRVKGHAHFCQYAHALRIMKLSDSMPHVLGLKLEESNSESNQT